MKRTFGLVLLATLILSACALGTAPTSTPATSVALLPTDTPAPTVTPTSTSTPTTPPTATPTSIPTLPPEQVGGLTGVPDPRFSNPELFDLNDPNAPIPQFVNAMGMAGISLDPREVFAQLQKNLRVLKGKQGTPFVVAEYIIPDGRPLSGVYPLLFAHRNSEKWEWSKLTIGKYGTMLGLNIGTTLGGYGYAQYYNDLIRVQREHFNYGMVIAGMFAFQGPKFVYFTDIDSDVRLGVRNRMPMMAHLLVWPAHVPDWLRNGAYSAEEIREIVKWWIITVMQRYPQVETWEVINEVEKGDFFMNRLGNDYFVEFYRTARQARPDAVLI